MSVGLDVNGAIAIITLDRPKARNAIDPETTVALASAFARVEDDPDIWVAVLTGAPPVFCAGADLKAISAGNERQLSDEHGFASITRRARVKPLIAAVSGPALAGGTEIVLACDLVVAERGASFGLPEVKRSLLAAAGGLYRLPRVLPRNIAMECLLTGDPISAEQAAAHGLVNLLVENGRALEQAIDLGRRICGNAPVAVRESRRLALALPGCSDDIGQAESSTAMRQILRTRDAAEGMRAFIEKRAPHWTGE